MRKLFALLIALMLCTTTVFAEAQIFTAPDDWTTFPIGLANLTISLPGDFQADQLPEDDPMFLGSWSNESVSVSAMIVGDSLDNVYETMKMYVGSDFNTVTESSANDLRCVVADTLDGEIAYAYVAISEELCLCVIATRMEAGYEMDFALLDVVSSITIAE